MPAFTWLRNTLRNRLRSFRWGRLLTSLLHPRPRTLLVVSATRLDEVQFWKQSALGKTLHAWREDPNVTIRVAFGNGRGLPEVYNAVLDDPALQADIVVFTHDDLWFNDPRWADKLRVALMRFDVVGVAGNTRRVPGQPAWLFRGVENGQFAWDHPHLSGAICHGIEPRGHPIVFGPAPAACELLDGVFLAVRLGLARRSGLRFDTRFDFHFYDLDFCRSARRRGLSLGTWLLDFTHQSRGNFGSPQWVSAWEKYRDKYGERAPQ